MKLSLFDIKGDWKTFEHQVLLSNPYVRLQKMNPEAIRIPGGRVVTKRGPCDFWGQVVGSGRSIVVDAKQCDQVTRFPIGNVTHFPTHQRQELVAAGRAGAISGLMIHASNDKVRRVYWLSWKDIEQLRDPSVEWTHPAMVELGASDMSIDWARVLMVSGVRA